MKTFCFLVLGAGWCMTLHAQTNSTAAAPVIVAPAAATPTNAPAPVMPPSEITIRSDKFWADLKSNIVIYTGHARVDDDPQMKLTCDVLRLEAPRLAQGKFNRAIAEGMVVIDFWQTNHATADKAVYTYSITNSVTNAVVVLTGNASVTNALGGHVGCDEIIWDRIHSTVSATGGHSTIKPGASDFTVPMGPAHSKTNASGPNAPAPSP